ncbi:family 78 glycoside hydrolase catalytic domain [Enterococcus sp.]|uniref:family 78 glycoside hydrolase catalytic domain n=1 Tax=Enterococcus sp. TaxID=35783 RepID=UPI002FC7672C
MKVNGVDSPVCTTQQVRLSWDFEEKQLSSQIKIWKEERPEELLFNQSNKGEQLWQDLEIDSPLESHSRYVFQVEKHGVEGSSVSEKAVVRGNHHEWQGKWISHPQGGTSQTEQKPAPMFRKKFAIDKLVKDAVLYISGLGFYEFRINNEKTTDSYLNQAFTQYDKTTLYDAWSIKENIKQGENKIDILLGNGWYNSFAKDAWDFDTAAWRKPPKVLFDLVIYYQDGSQECYSSDTDCLAGTSAIQFDGLRNGEYVDGTHPAFLWPEIESNLFADSPVIVDPPGGEIILNQMPPIRCNSKLAPVTIKKLWDNRFLIDFGRNISGWCELRLPEGSGKSEITIRYGERLSEEGILNQREIAKFLYSGDFQTDKFQNNNHKVNWHPYFVYHGFQYVEVEGLENITEEMIRAYFIHTDLEPLTKVKTNNSTLNWIQDAAVASTLGNYHGIPTDCPQREKNGWTGDVNLSCEQMLRNFDSEQAFKKWIYDIQDAQRISGELPGIVPTTGWGYSVGPAWDTVIIELPYQIYRHKGNRLILKEAFPNMKRYMAYLINRMENGLIQYGLGDWCAPNYSGNEADFKCPNEITGTAILYGACKKMAEICEIVEETGAEKYNRLASEVRRNFREKFIDLSDLKILSETQTAYATALYFELFEEDEIEQAIQNLVAVINTNNNRIDCGILGTKYLFPVLFENKQEELAFQLLTQPEYPGYGYWHSLGATTMWEHWKGFHSRNHHMFSSVSEYLFKYIAGIKLTEVGYRGVEINPSIIESLTQFSVEQTTIQGTYKVSIQGQKNKKITLSIPSNVNAVFKVPRGYQISNEVKQEIDLSEGEYIFELERKLL